MNNWLRIAGTLFILAAHCAAADGQLAATETGSKIEEIQVEIENNQLTLVARNALLFEVVRKIGEKAGFKTVVVANSLQSPLINISLKGAPITEAVEQLIRNTNRTVIYRSSGNTNEHRAISQVWLLGFEDLATASTGNNQDKKDSVEAAHTEGSAVLSNATLRLSVQANSSLLGQDEKDQIRQRLGQVLHSNQSALVRSRAAIALGGLGDQQNVAILKPALTDQHSSIRAQVISALGQIGGEEAITTLGNVLLNTNSSTTDRIIAAQALWKHQSESNTARDYLRTGMDDKNKLVSLASTKSPPNITTRRNLQQLGAEHVQ